MIFNSLQFLIFFPIVVLVYFVIPRKLDQIWLLIASYYFYMCWNAKYAVLILFSTVVTYASGLALERIKQSRMNFHQKENAKKAAVALSFLLNLGVLFGFKYFNFFIDILSRAFQLINIELNIPLFDVLLPVGISFYTFQALSYTMDVYREEIYAEKNFFRYALFVSFFPQLVAGPIERSKNLLKELAKPKKFCFETARDGFLLMLWGFFLKIVVADRIAIFVDTVYGDYGNYTGCYLIVATVLFAFQIYCDFYGYSVIAMGAAEIMGIQLMENFDAPYLAVSVAEFWRRWHISLTSWFKDYLYIPLGGSRKGKLRKYVNKMIVFLVSGLWHGARLSYVAWGGINGLYQIVGEMLTPVRKRLIAFFHLNRDSFGHKFVSAIITFILVDFSWVFFRAQSLKQAAEILKCMLLAENFWIFWDGSLYQCGLDSKNFGFMILCIGILVFADLCKYKKIAIREVIQTQDWWFRELFVAGTVLFILIFGKYGLAYDAANFIYFQF